MIVKRIPNEYGSSDFKLINDGIGLSIMQTGDDHTLIARHQVLTQVDKIDFLVAKSDNEEIYELFSNLYERIITGNVMGYNPNHPDILARMESERNTAWYKSTVRDGVISIMSDAYPIRCPNILTIRKEDGVVVLEFDKIDGKEFHEPKSKYDISINIRQSGSRIYDLAFPFRLLFRELQSVNIEDVKEKKLSTNM